MDDLISRQAAIDHLKKRLYETALNNITEHPYYEELADNRVDVWLNELPPAQPDLQPTCNQLATDCISRQAASGCEYWDSESNFCSLHRPSAERRGRWVKGDEMADYPRVPYKPWETYCSCCGEIKEQSNDGFCGNCGAKMDEVDE